MNHPHEMTFDELLAGKVQAALHGTGHALTASVMRNIGNILSGAADTSLDLAQIELGRTPTLSDNTQIVLLSRMVDLQYVFLLTARVVMPAPESQDKVTHTLNLVSLNRHDLSTANVVDMTPEQEDALKTLIMARMGPKSVVVAIYMQQMPEEAGRPTQDLTGSAMALAAVMSGEANITDASQPSSAPLPVAVDVNGDAIVLQLNAVEHKTVEHTAIPRAPQAAAEPKGPTPV